MEKMTLKEMYGEIINLAIENDREDIVTFCEGRIEQINKKNAKAKSSDKKLTDEQIAIRSAIVEYLKTVDKASVGQICVAIGVSSNQKVTGNLTQLKKQGIVAEPIKEKKVNYYSLVPTETVEEEVEGGDE